MTNVKSGSIIITVRCENKTALLKLMIDSESGKLTEHFRPLQESIRRTPGYEGYKLTAAIRDQSYLCILKDLGNLLLIIFFLSQDEIIVVQTVKFYSTMTLG